MLLYICSIIKERIDVFMKTNRKNNIRFSVLSVLLIFCVLLGLSFYTSQETNKQQNNTIEQATLLLEEPNTNIQELYKQLEDSYPIKITNKTELLIDNGVISKEVKGNFTKTVDNYRIYQTLLGMEEVFLCFLVNFGNILKQKMKS